MALSDSEIQRAYRLRIAVFIVCAVLLVIVLDLGDQTVQALRIVSANEYQRDSWQQPAMVIAALHLKVGSKVADIGCGAGYFALKLAPVVGSSGRVLAEDILRTPLIFLWIRALLHLQLNLHVLLGNPDDPHLPAESFDAVLIANTYHEFRHPRAVVDCVFRALRRSGRLVVLDRGPTVAGQVLPDTQGEHHEIPPAVVQSELRESGFEVVSQQDRFIDLSSGERPGDRPDEHNWWLIVARKP